MVALRTARWRSPISAPSGVGVFAMGGLPARSHLVGLLALLAACGGRGSDASARSASTPARRIVSLSPASTELLFALGAGDRVVGRTTWCDYPPEARRVPSVGDGLNPNLEAILALRPDLVVLYRSPLNQTAARRLGALGIAAPVLAQDRLEDLAQAARVRAGSPSIRRGGIQSRRALTRCSPPRRLPSRSRSPSSCGTTR
jgi:ABC-type hemin transport system substrate-binding protein